MKMPTVAAEVDALKEQKTPHSMRKEWQPGYKKPPLDDIFIGCDNNIQSSVIGYSCQKTLL